jgi:heavy metal sensor kinase
MKDWPLRWQLALLTATLVGLVLAGAGMAAAWHLYREGVDDLDTDLRFVAKNFYSKVPADPHTVDWANNARVQELLPVGHHLFLAEVSTDAGEILFSSDELVSMALPKMPTDADFSNVMIGGRQMRMGEFHHRGLTLRLTTSMRSLSEARADSLRGYLIAGPIILAIVAAGGWWIARRALSPVESITAAAERITAQRLDQRLPVPPANDELRRLTNVLNHMIDRLEGSFRQAMRFTSDASHELKTPLTIIRGELESAIREGGAFSPAHERLLVNLLEETERLSRITEGLLLLSRADAGHLRVQQNPLDLAELLRELLEDAEILAAPSEIAIEAKLPPHASIMGDANFLRQLLLNLIDNAIKYNQTGGRVEVRLDRQGPRWVVTVGNTGPTIPEDNAAHLFDRFYRGDESRNGSRPGHGLGLNICREIARAHGGDVRLRVSREGWTEFTFEVAAADATTEKTRPVALAHG